MTVAVEVLPVTAERWADLEKLFGKGGACAGCWCMWFRQTGAEYSANRGEANRTSLSSLVESGRVPGLLAYVEGRPAGWVSVAPRDDFPRLAKSRASTPIDATPVWSVVCFYIGRGFRRRGLMRPLAEAAADYAREQGAEWVEAYPKDSDLTRVSTGAAYVGIASAFAAAGYEEVGRPQPSRPTMRKRLA